MARKERTALRAADIEIEAEFSAKVECVRCGEEQETECAGETVRDAREVVSRLTALGWTVGQHGDYFGTLCPDCTKTMR